MSIREVGRRLRAWEAGAPSPRYSTIHHAVAPPDRALIVAFVRMAGESRPWGVAWGYPGDPPRCLSVPDGRVRDDVGTMCARFAEDLLEHFRVHNWTYDPATQDEPVAALRQIWLPNGQHVELLHQLNYAYSQTKFGGDDQLILNAFGRLCGWLFRESSRRGCQHLIDASAALRDAFAFPAQDVRQAHLGFLLAWLSTSGDREARLEAAAACERSPVSPTMDPNLERDLLEPALSRRREGKDPARAELAIRDALHDELLRRWQLCSDAHDVLVADPRPRNAGVEDLVKEAVKEFWYQHQRIELNLADPNQGPAFVAHPETDFHGSAAASRFLTYAAADEAYVSALIHDDAELLQEAIEDGHAIRVTVQHIEDDGVGKSIVPIWSVFLPLDGPQRLREGGRLTPYGARGHEVQVRRLEQLDGGLAVELEWITRKTMAIGGGPTPIDPLWIGDQVTFVSSDASGLTKRRSQSVWNAKDGPGAWLTHGRPPALIVADIANDQPDVIIDDIRQIEKDAS